MGTITPRPRKAGAVACRAEGRSEAGGGKVVLKLVETFDGLKAAEAWTGKKEKELSTPAGVDAAIAAKSKPTAATHGDAIERTP